MNHRMLVAVLVGLVVPALAAHKPVPRVAVLTDARGQVEVKRAGGTSFQLVNYTTVLSASDLVRTGPDGSTVLLLPAGDRKSLAAAAHWSAPAAGKPSRAFHEMVTQIESVLGPQAAPNDLRGFVLRGFVLRGNDEHQPLQATAPRFCSVPEARPTFRWASPQDATGVTVTLYDRNENVLWTLKASAGQTSATYPADRNPLAAGEYLWEVLAKVNGTAELASAKFWVQSAAQRDQAQADLKSARAGAESDRSNLRLIAALLQHRLYPQAEAELQAATQRSGADRTLMLLLARVHSETHRSVPAEVQRAIESGAR